MNEEEPQYVCNRCNEISIEGNLMISHDEKNNRLEYFYCNECFNKLFGIVETDDPEQFKMLEE